MSFNNFFSDDDDSHKKHDSENEEFYKILNKEIYKSIRQNIEQGNKGCFYELPIFRYGQAIGNVRRMVSVVQKKLSSEHIDVVLIHDGPFIFINWQDVSEATVRNRHKYGESSEDALVNKYRQMFPKKK